MQKPTITVRLKPYLREFLICKLQEDANCISRINIIGAILEPLVAYLPKNEPLPKPHPDDFTFEIPTVFNLLNTKHHTVYVPEYNQKIFARILRMYFYEIFFNYMDDKVRYKDEIKDCIFLFCSDYNITFNQIKFDTLSKSYYRYRQKKKRYNLSLTCP